MKINLQKTASPTILLILLFLAGCMPGGLFGPTLTPLPPTATPTPVPRTLTICLGQEPDSLYLYGTISTASQQVLQAIYDGPFDSQGTEVDPVILKKTPSLADGDILLLPLEIKAGDEVVNADGNLVTLTAGVEVFPAGCSNADCIIAWDGVSPLQVNQMSVTYEMKAGLKWSDGQPLIASDSVYSFQIASDPVTPLNREQVDLTESYTAQDETSLIWVGKPGFVTSAIEHFFWAPLPQHHLTDLDAEQLLTSDLSTKQPLGWGPYMLQSWQAGQVIHLARNPNYHRIGQGLPKFEFLDFRFLAPGVDPLAAVQSGTCDFVDGSAVSYDSFSAVAASDETQQVKAIISPGKEWEILAFGIKPVSYDDNYYPYGTDRPDIFGDVRVRQAIASCIDREGIINDLLFGLADVPFAFLPADHPSLTTDADVLPYDLVKAGELLTAVGWPDYDNDPATPRVAITAANVPYGTQLSFTYITADSGLRREIAERIVTSLAQCGIQVKLTTYPAGELYQPAPDGLLFGRKFDLAQLAWQVDGHTGCDLFSSVEIPTQQNFWVGAVTGGANFTGYINTSLDEACTAMNRAGINADVLKRENQNIAALVHADLPVVPLFFLPEVQLARVDLCGLNADPLTGVSLQGLESWEYGSNCQTE